MTTHFNLVLIARSERSERQLKFSFTRIIFDKRPTIHNFTHIEKCLVFYQKENQTKSKASRESFNSHYFTFSKDRCLQLVTASQTLTCDFYMRLPELKNLVRHFVCFGFEIYRALFHSPLVPRIFLQSYPLSEGHFTRTTKVFAQDV